MQKISKIYSFIFLLTCTGSFAYAHVQSLAIPSSDFESQKALFFLVENQQTNQSLVGVVPLDMSKTHFSCDEYTLEQVTALSTLLSKVEQTQHTVIIPQEYNQEYRQESSHLVYLSFETKDQYSIVKAMVIKQSLLYDNPCEVVVVHTAMQDEEDDMFACMYDSSETGQEVEYEEAYYVQHTPSKFDTYKLAALYVYMVCKEEISTKFEEGSAYVRSQFRKHF